MSLLRSKIKEIFRSKRRKKGAPSPIITADILSVVLPLLHRSDLVRALRVNRLFYEIAAPLLYGSSAGVAYGEEWHWIQKANGAGSIPRNIFAGVVKPAPPHIPQSTRQSPPLAISHPPFLPSPMKINLLRHVRHLSYHSHHPEESDLIPVPLFPNLETLTLHQPAAGPLVDWTSPLLLNLRPKHVRLVHIQDQLPTPYPWRLASTFGNGVEKVTVHLMNCLPIYHHPCVIRPSYHIAWPPAVRQIDIVFLAPKFWSFGQDAKPVFWRTSSPAIVLGDMSDVAVDIAAVLVSAAPTGARMRLVGLGKKFQRSYESPATVDDSEGYEEEFLCGLRRAYASGLEKGGMQRDMAAERVDQLELLTLDEYWRQDGSLAF